MLIEVGDTYNFLNKPVEPLSDYVLFKVDYPVDVIPFIEKYCTAKGKETHLYWLSVYNGFKGQRWENYINEFYNELMDNQIQAQIHNKAYAMCAKQIAVESHNLLAWQKQLRKAGAMHTKKTLQVWFSSNIKDLWDSRFDSPYLHILPKSLGCTRAEWYEKFFPVWQEYDLLFRQVLNGEYRPRTPEESRDLDISMTRLKRIAINTYALAIKYVESEHWTYGKKKGSTRLEKAFARRIKKEKGVLLQ